MTIFLFRKTMIVFAFMLTALFFTGCSSDSGEGGGSDGGFPSADNIFPQAEDADFPQPATALHDKTYRVANKKAADTYFSKLKETNELELDCNSATRCDGTLSPDDSKTYGVYAEEYEDNGVHYILLGISVDVSVDASVDANALFNRFPEVSGDKIYEAVSYVYPFSI
ncbi:MAG: hypothetical protein LBD73_03815, partial [Deferribacteraceae bacterium]|nr:hypothetical protein [Deferribacteraceae bacterium]